MASYICMYIYILYIYIYIYLYIYIYIYIYTEYQVFDLIELRLMYYLIEVANANQITYANQL